MERVAYVVRTILITLLLVTVCFPGAIYVRDGDSGSGTSWSDAYDQIPATLTRGDTAWIGDGAYAAYSFNDAVSGTDSIWVLKATESAHGTGTGWNSNYGDGTATFTCSSTYGFQITTDYWYIDGIVGADSGSTAYGFYIDGTSPSTQTKGIKISAGVNNVYLGHIKIVMGGENELSNDGIYAIGQGTGSTVIKLITVTNCCIMDCGRVHGYFQYTDSITTQYCYFIRNFSSTTQHSESVQYKRSGTIWHRFNWHEDCEGTMIVGLHNTDSNGSRVYTGRTFHIYGNIFYQTPGYSGEGPGHGCVSDWDNTAWADNVNVYNNTAIGIDGNNNYSGMIARFPGASAEGGSGTINIYNNIMYDCDVTSYVWAGVDDHDYNYYYNSGNPSETNLQNGSSSTFVNLAGKNFHLASATNDGKSDLGSPYTTDIDGNTRGADDVWDRGAYEYVGEGAAPPVKSGKVVRIGDQTYD